MTERLAHDRHGGGPDWPAAIDVAAIVTDTVASRGHNLVTRPTGRAVREAIEQRLTPMSPSPFVMLIDFTRVRILDFSCADEVVAKLLLRYHGPDRPGNIFFLFRAVDEMHRHAVEEVLARHGLAAVCDVGGGFQLLGPATPEERKAWDTLERCERIRPRDLAGALGELGEPLLRGLARRRLAYWSGNGGAAALSALARTR
ncbi:MAG: hypothetical protein F4Z31_14565 [Gemmatimonadetes bacterium]|nr:hypothetical protein [Gemmatimonadota bacterium]MYA42961.1 hypothetical protein [Gemmatimonadota bacterium]MYE93258.1 hypothetical protein [Gemmatimonadota bacterium]MYJ10728.1 hypothetical protein [Gemmatimonadota bacterium]